MLRHLDHHERALVSQIKQYAACNAEHEFQLRFARWLSRATALTGSTDLPLKHEDAAVILGAQRTTVTIKANELRNAGIIEYARGRMRVKEISRLRETACECYLKIEASYKRALKTND